MSDEAKMPQIARSMTLCRPVDASCLAIEYRPKACTAFVLLSDLRYFVF